ncbi:hypothetical protein B0T25DRAFT_548126 [Lasiosphaeria hispida]|uniref:Uncharacterized protein n=1 Tax=Lasiosphaeria hispida TaxID=260671 RepID=A0AAJ0MCB6_9PEZI|nr:hypothetical protein B0T25DRAFT_548126 [Lasiosphaeria hispida]
MCQRDGSFRHNNRQVCLQRTDPWPSAFICFLPAVLAASHATQISSFDPQDACRWTLTGLNTIQKPWLQCSARIPNLAWSADFGRCMASRRLTISSTTLTWFHRFLFTQPLAHEEFCPRAGRHPFLQMLNIVAIKRPFDPSLVFSCCSKTFL